MFARKWVAPLAVAAAVWAVAWLACARLLVSAPSDGLRGNFRWATASSSHEACDASRVTRRLPRVECASSLFERRVAPWAASESVQAGAPLKEQPGLAAGRSEPNISAGRADPLESGEDGRLRFSLGGHISRVPARCGFAVSGPIGGSDVVSQPRCFWWFRSALSPPRA